MSNIQTISIVLRIGGAYVLVSLAIAMTRFLPVCRTYCCCLIGTRTDYLLIDCAYWCMYMCIPFPQASDDLPGAGSTTVLAAGTEQR